MNTKTLSTSSLPTYDFFKDNQLEYGIYSSIKLGETKIWDFIVICHEVAETQYIFHITKITVVKRIG